VARDFCRIGIELVEVRENRGDRREETIEIEPVKACFAAFVARVVGS
jgi:hypothetical protein